MIRGCVFRKENVYYFSLMTKYIRKGDVNIDDSILESVLIGLVNNKNENIFQSIDASEYLFYLFELSNNAGVKFSTTRIFQALHECKNPKCKQILIKYLQ